MKKAAVIISVFIFIVIIVLFLFGPLFPYSPVILGFEKKEFSRAVVYFHKGADYSGYSNVDTLVEQAEEFHGVKFRKKPEIIITSSDAERFRLSGGKARMTTYMNRIIVAGRVAGEATSGRIHIDIYLRHELSHALLFSNSDIIRAYLFPEWLREGLAVYSAGQRGVGGYYTGEFVREKIKFFIPPGGETPEMRKDLEKEFPGTTGYFIYSEWATIVEAIIKEYGMEKFMAYVRAVLAGGQDKKVFMDVFGQDFDGFMDGFYKKAYKS